MSKMLVYICSPFRLRGEYEKNTENARKYCRDAMRLYPDVVPIAPHLLYPQFLNDTDATERTIGISAGLELLDRCDEIWVYGLQNPTEGMQTEIEYALQNGIPIRDGFDLNNTMGPQEEEIGDALLVIPSQSDHFAGVAVIESTTVRISGEVVMELAQNLRRNKGHDVTVEAVL